MYTKPADCSLPSLMNMQLIYFSVKTTEQRTNAADLVQCPQKENQALIVKLSGYQCISMLTYTKCESSNAKTNLDVDLDVF